MKFSVYLAGKIPKGKERASFNDWRQVFRDSMERKREAYPEISKIVYLDPHTLPIESLGSTLEFFGRDVHMVSMSNAVVVDATIKVGAGTAQEILIAKYYGKPVVSVIPRNSHYWRKTVVHGSDVDYKHPFLFETSDTVVERFEDAAEWLLKYFAGEIKQKIKCIEIIEEAKRRYLNSRGGKDEFVIEWEKEMRT